jgi:ankyrin repeat protein
MPINNDGDTLLIWACYQGYDAIVEFLMADPEVNLLKTDFHGFDAMTVCQHTKRDHLMNKLKAVLETRHQTTPPALFEFAEPEKLIATPKNTIKDWLYGGKSTSNQNTPPLRAERFR